MLNCKFCDKECKNKNSLAQHEIRCSENDNRIVVTSNFKEHNEKLKSGEKEGTNQFLKAKKLGLEKPKVSEETKQKMKSSKRPKWSEEQKKKHSEIMLEVVRKNPKSYSSNNVCGRTKLKEIKDSFGNDTKVNGSWELIVANYLNINNIKWTNIINDNFTYFYENKIRNYYPDFYLPEYNFYLEIKGYERPRDLIKWASFSNKLLILKKNEINLIKNSKYNIFNFIN